MAPALRLVLFMTTSRDHRKLRVFHDAHALAIDTYRQTRAFLEKNGLGFEAR